MSLDSSFPLAPGNKQSEQCRLTERSLFFSQRFLAHPLHGKYAKHRTLKKSICAPKEYEKNEKEAPQYVDYSGECFPFYITAITYPSAPAPWLFSTVQVFPSQE